MTFDEFMASELTAEKDRTDAILAAAATMTETTGAAVLAFGAARAKLAVKFDAERQARQAAFGVVETEPEILVEKKAKREKVA